MQPPHWFLRPASDLRVAGSYDHCLLNQTLDGAGAATRRRLRRDDTYSRIPTLPTGFSSGAKVRNLSGRSQTSCLPLHHNLPAHGLCFRRTDPGFRYSQPDLARRLDHSRARFCQASADLHCRCSARPEKCALSSEGLSDPGQTLGGTIPAGRAHGGRCDLSDALGLTSYSKR